MSSQDRVVVVLAFIAAVGSGVVGGVLFAFSSFVMAALAELPAAQGVAAMRAINVTAVNPAFMLALFGTAVVCVGIGFRALFFRRRRSGRLLLAGSLLYLLGSIAVTALANVPLNDRLASGTLDEAVAFWPRFVSAWTAWNHVRTGASIAAAASFIGALLERA